MLLLFACILLLLCDIYYFGWMYNINLQMPSQWGIKSRSALMGYSGQLKEQLSKEMTIAKVQIANSKEKASKGIKSISGMRKAKKNEVPSGEDKDVDQSVKQPSLTREVEMQEMSDNN